MASLLPTCGTPMILYVLIAMLTGWINRHRQQVIAALSEKIGCVQHACG